MLRLYGQAVPVYGTLATRRVAPRPVGVGRKNEGRVSDPPGYLNPVLRPQHWTGGRRYVPAQAP